MFENAAKQPKISETSETFENLRKFQVGVTRRQFRVGCAARPRRGCGRAAAADVAAAVAAASALNRLVSLMTSRSVTWGQHRTGLRSSIRRWRLSRWMFRSSDHQNPLSPLKHSGRLGRTTSGQSMDSLTSTNWSRTEWSSWSAFCLLVELMASTGWKRWTHRSMTPE